MLNPRHITVLVNKRHKLTYCAETDPQIGEELIYNTAHDQVRLKIIRLIRDVEQAGQKYIASSALTVHCEVV